MAYKNLFKSIARIFQSQRILPPYSHACQIGDPVLRTKCMEIEVNTIQCKEVQDLIGALVHTMRRYGCAGLSSNQIGMPFQIFAMEFLDSWRRDIPPAVYKAREMKSLPLTIIINPKLTVTDKEILVHVEACQSVTGYEAKVPRYRGVSIDGYDQDGNAKKWDFTGWNARIAQHEVDHLNGICYTDIMDPKTFACCFWDAVNAKEGKVKMPFYPKRR